MFALRRMVAPNVTSCVIPDLRVKRLFSQKIETAIPAQAAAAQQHGQIVQQTPNAIAPQPAKELPQDDGLYWTALGLLLFTPPIVWFYYQHRKEHMGKKKEQVLQRLAEKRAAFQREMGK